METGPRPAEAAPRDAGDAPAGRSAWVLPAHVLGMALVQSSAWGMQFLIPVIARKTFDASDWLTLAATAWPTVCFVLSIFWNDALGRMSLRRYMTVFWCVACLPYAATGLGASFWLLMGAHGLASIGGAGFYPVAGELLKRLYPERVRGRTYSVIWATVLASGAFLAWGLGAWLARDAEAFRVFMPILAAGQLGGVVVLTLLARSAGVEAARAKGSPRRAPWRPGTLLEPVAHLGEVLRADHAFARYEGAYMTYGAGWMIGTALLPLLVTRGLHLEYDQIARSTQVAYLLAMLLALAPAGWLLDRVGPVRSTALSFALLAAYPLGLIAARGEGSLLAASVFYGVAHTGASVGWMLGPVSLAPSQAKVAQYVAIHATLVGVRGALFQFLGVWLYRATGDFTWPLALASACYLWSAWQMWRLHVWKRRHPAPIAEA